MVIRHKQEKKRISDSMEFYLKKLLAHISQKKTPSTYYKIVHLSFSKGKNLSKTSSLN